MARASVPEELWERIEPPLPPHPAGRHGGRRWVSDRACLGGIPFVLRSVIPWGLFPPEFGVGRMS